jgi:hypothetical protein
MKNLFIAVLLFLCGCHKDYPRMSNQFLFQSVDYLNEKEYVKVYYDMSNNNICYIYYGYDVSISCMKDNRESFP